MTFTNSTLTIADVISDIQFDYGLGTVPSTRVIVSGINKWMSIYKRLERDAYPDRATEEASATLGTTGYPLSSLTDLGSDSEGLEVYKTEAKPLNLIPKTQEGAGSGWYIKDGEIFANTADAGDVVIRYIPTTPKYAYTVATTTVLPIDRDVEEAVKLYAVAAFYRSRQEIGMAVEAEEQSFDWLVRYFRKPSKAVAL